MKKCWNNDKVNATISPKLHIHPDGKTSLDSVALTSYPVKMICIKCGREVSPDDSFSNRGENCMCRECVEEGMKEEGFELHSEYCKKYIWNINSRENLSVIRRKCIKCGQLVTLADSFSDSKGDNCHCTECIQKGMKEKGITSHHEYFKTHIWKEPGE